MAPLRRTLISGGLSRDAMRRIVARTGYPGIESWSGHNKGNMRGVRGVLAHHTGTAWSAKGDYPTLRVVRDGRSGLVNSLSSFGLGKSGSIYLINTQVSWHAGTGNLNGITDGNGYLVGIEAESDGWAGHWTPEQVDCYPRLVASILIEIRENRRYTGRHQDYALPRGRKTDFAGWPGGIDAFWRQVDHYLAHPEQIHRNGGSGAPIIGAIRAAYDRQVPGLAPWGFFLGPPKGPEVPTLDKVGRWQEFQNGAILWHPDVVDDDGQRGVAHVVWGAILEKFWSLGAETFCGYPTTDERSTPDTRGRYNHFAHPHGLSIYWTPETGAYEVHGAIRDRWASLGWEVGVGYPVTDESVTPDGEGRYNHFEGGPHGPSSIYWHPAIGAHPVWGWFRETWAARRWEAGELGYPVSPEYVEGGRTVQDFQRGRLVLHADRVEVVLA